MIEGAPKNEKPKPKQVPEIWSTDRKVIKEEEIKKIQKYVKKNIMGVDQLKIPGQAVTSDELLELMKNIGKLEEMEKIAQMDAKDNPIKLRYELEEYIKELKKENIEFKKLINESRDNGGISLMIDYILKRQYNNELIKNLRRKFNEIRDEN